MKSFVLAAALTAFAITAPPAWAQDTAAAPEPDAAGDSITIGGGVAYLPDYEGSNDYRFTPAPAAIGRVAGFNFLLAGNRLNVDVIPDSGDGDGWDFQFGPVGVVNFNRTRIRSIDDTRVRALGELDTAIELGGYAGIAKTGIITSPYDRLSVTLTYRHDVSNTHDSSVLTPSISYMTPLSRKAAVGLVASADRIGAGYARTYFGVTPGQSLASTLPVYTPDSGWKSYSLGGFGTVALTGDLLHGFKLVAGGTYSRMIDDIGDSPVVRIAGSRGQWLGAVGLAYTF